MAEIAIAKVWKITGKGEILIGRVNMTRVAEIMTGRGEMGEKWLEGLK